MKNKFVPFLVGFLAAQLAIAAEPQTTAKPVGSCVDLTNAELIALHPEQQKWSIFPGKGPTDMPKDMPQMTVLEGGPGSPGMTMYKIKYNTVGFRSKPHAHPVAERIYVLSGSLSSVVGSGGDEAAVTFKAGSYSTIPAYTRHYAIINEPSEVLVIVAGDYIPLPEDAKRPAAGN